VIVTPALASDDIMNAEQTLNAYSTLFMGGVRTVLGRMDPRDDLLPAPVLGPDHPLNVCAPSIDGYPIQLISDTPDIYGRHRYRYGVTIPMSSISLSLSRVHVGMGVVFEHITHPDVQVDVITCDPNNFRARIEFFLPEVQVLCRGTIEGSRAFIRDGYISIAASPAYPTPIDMVYELNAHDGSQNLNVALCAYGESENEIVRLRSQAQNEITISIFPFPVCLSDPSRQAATACSWARWAWGNPQYSIVIADDGNKLQFVNVISTISNMLQAYVNCRYDYLRTDWHARSVPPMAPCLVKMRQHTSSICVVS